MRARHPLLEYDFPLKHRLPFVTIVEDALPPEVCDRMVARIETEGPDSATISTAAGDVMDKGMRNNDRVIFDDPALAADLFARTREIVPETLHKGVSIGYNERFRGYRYNIGQRFKPHFDGAFVRNRSEYSQITVLFYLNEGFSGGETRLIDYETVIIPRKGMAFLFEHAMLHEGAPVLAGTKYVLRTDAMYRF
jgi:hypothetical protein